MSVPLDGYVLVDKPAGVSSFSAVQRVRRALGIGGRRGRKAGHAGTLDPFATGLLLVAVGHATRLMPWLVGCDKRYLMRIALGAASSTDDATGELTRVSGSAVLPDEVAVLAALQEVAHRREQRPPAISAIHVDGERAYRRVRRGEELELPPRPVRYEHVELLALEPAHDGLLDAVVDVRCGSGTYMRSLARDVGELLGCGAHARTLRRLEVGAWSVDGAPAPADVTLAHIRPMAELVGDRDAVVLDAPGAVAFAHGQRLAEGFACTAGGDDVAVLDTDGALMGIAHLDDQGVLHPRSVFVAPPPRTGGEAAAPTSGGSE